MESQPQLTLLGVSFRTAPVAVREALRFQPDEAATLLRQLVADRPGTEAFILSTCNRTEFYLVAGSGAAAAAELLARLRTLRPDAPILREDCHRYQLSGTAAVQHLLRVASGLDSAIPGDAQILGQVKAAMQIAAETRSLGAVLQHALTLAIRAGKRARTETRVGWGAASLGSAIVDLIAERENAARVLVLGAGEIARDIGRHLSKRGGRQVTFLNRTLTRAVELAELCGGRAGEWSTLSDELHTTDVVIAATACAKPVVTRDVLDAAVARRAGRRLLVLDAGLPRNVEPGSRAELLNLDAIRERQDGVLARRRAAIPQVERIVADELGAWSRWCALRPVEGMLKTLFRNAADTSRDLARECSTISDAAALERMLERRISRLLYQHARDLRGLFVPVAGEP